MKESQEKNSKSLVINTEKKGLDLFSRYDESLAIIKANRFNDINQEIYDVITNEFQELLRLAKGLLQDNLNLIVEKSQLQATNDLERVTRKFELVG